MSKPQRSARASTSMRPRPLSSSRLAGVGAGSSKFSSHTSTSAATPRWKAGGGCRPGRYRRNSEGARRGQPRLVRRGDESDTTSSIVSARWLGAHSQARFGRADERRGWRLEGPRSARRCGQPTWPSARLPARTSPAHDPLQLWMARPAPELGSCADEPIGAPKPSGCIPVSPVRGALPFSAASRLGTRAWAGSWSLRPSRCSCKQSFSARARSVPALRYAQEGPWANGNDPHRARRTKTKE